MLPVEIRESAQTDADYAIEFLNRHRANLGFRFRALLELTIDRIRRHPLAAPELIPEVRRALVPTFKFRMLYTVEPQRIVVSVFSTPPGQRTICCAEITATTIANNYHRCASAF